MVEALIINAFFGLSSLSFQCKAASYALEESCPDIRTSMIKHGIPIDKSHTIGQSGTLEITINATKLGIADEDSPAGELLIVSTRFVVKRRLVDSEGDGGYVYNAVVYMHSDTALVTIGEARARVEKVSTKIIDEIADQWNRSHHRDST